MSTRISNLASKSSTRGHGSGKSSSSKSSRETNSSQSMSLAHKTQNPIPHAKDKQSKDESSLAEATPVWKMIKRDNKPGTRILAVTNEDGVKPLRTLVRSKDTKAKVSICTPEQLQEEIDAKAGKDCISLRIFVSSAVSTITYRISSKIRDVYIGSCSVTARPDVLRIGSLSEYCGFRTSIWGYRPEVLRKPKYQINHGEGCYFDLSDDPVGMARHKPLQFVPEDHHDEDLNDGQRDEVLKHLAEMEQMKADKRAGIPGTDDADGLKSWWNSCKAFLAVVVGAGTGVGTFGMWCSAGGFFIKGPLGLSLSCGYFTAGVAGGACLAGAGTAMSAAAVIYFVPWGRVFEYVKLVLSSIWDRVRDMFSWIWERIKGLGETVIASLGF